MRPPEEALRELVAQWLGKADDDLGLAEHLLAEGSPYREAIAFHAQQAAEKVLKAFLVQRQVEFRKTHDLAELLEVVATVDTGLAQALIEVTELTPHAVEFRYPGESEPLGAPEVERAVHLARSAVEAVRTALAR